MACLIAITLIGATWVYLWMRLKLHPKYTTCIFCGSLVRKTDKECECGCLIEEDE
jgi:hypothetical protein